MKRNIFKIKNLLFVIAAVLVTNVFYVMAGDSDPLDPIDPEIPPVEYTVYFDAGNGDAIVSQNVIEKQCVPEPGNPRWNYRKFECWLLNGERFSFETPITESITLYGKWSLLEYNITYSDELTDVDDFPKNFKLNDKIQLPAVSKPGYNFLLWKARMGAKNYEFYDKDYILDDPTFEYKKYLPTDEPADCFISASFNPYLYKIKYDANADNYVGTMSAESNRAYESKYRLKSCGYSRVGYKFAGWNTLKNPVNDEGAPDTLKGIWFDDAGDYSSNDFVKQNLDFRDGSGREGTKFVDNDTITLYAQWELVKYDVSFYLDKGYFDEEGVPFIIFDGSIRTTTNTPPENFTINESIVIPDPKRDGYNFTEWRNQKAAGTVLSSTIPKGTDSPKAYYAMWKPKEYKLEFDNNGGSGEMNPLDVTYDKYYRLPLSKFSKKGFKFAGWNTLKDPSIENPGTHYDNLAEITPAADWHSTEKLYAQWELEDYAIKYVMDGGYFDFPVRDKVVYSYSIQSNDIEVPDPTRLGYYFVLWREGSRTSVSCNTVPKGSTGNKTFYADWDPISYSITLYSNFDDEKTGTDREPSKTLQCTYGEIYKLPEKLFEKSGYTFEGWTYKRDGYPIEFAEGESVTNLTSTPDYDVKLYAQWRRIPNGEVIKGEDFTVMNLGDSKKFDTDYLLTKGIKLSKYSTPSWVSSKPNVVSVDQKGVLTAIAAGTCEITINAYDELYYPELDYKIYVTVKKPILKVDKKSLVLYTDDRGDDNPDNDIFDKYTLDVKIDGETLTPVFSTSDMRVAVVDKEKGIITAVSEGECVISVEANGLTCYIDVTVIKAGIQAPINYLELSTMKGLNTYYVVPKVDGKTKKIEWKSYDPKICSVSNGRLTAKKAGETVIVATANDRSTVINVKVIDAPVILKAPELFVYPETTRDTPIYLNTKGTNTKYKLDYMLSGSKNKVVWSSSDPKVAKVASGVVTGKNTGDAIITATANGIRVSRHVHVEKTTALFELRKYNLNADLNPTLSLRSGLMITGIDTNKANVIWKSSNNTIANVSNGINGGVITPIRQGNVKITATINGISTSTQVFITKTAISLNTTYLKLEPDNKKLNNFKLRAFVTGPLKTVTYTSSNPEVVSVKSGRVTALKPGYAIITAEANNKKCTCTVLSVASVDLE